MRLSWAVALCAVLVASHVNAAEKIQLKTDKDKLSYQKGVYLGNSFKRQSIDVDQKIFLQGVEDAISGAPTLLTVKEMVTIEENYQKEQAAKKTEEKRKLAEKNKKEGDAFLAANAKKEGVIILPSGLQYKIIEKGSGNRPVATDSVKVNFRMTQIDGTVIDDSEKRPVHPSVIPVSGDKRFVPLGWTEALQLMPEGSKWQLVIPANLAFGEQGMGTIGPNMTFIMDVELISVENTSKAETKVEKVEKTGKTEKKEKKKN